MWCQNFICTFFRFVTKHACDGQTDGQNYDPQDRANIAASHGKNYICIEEWSTVNKTSYYMQIVTVLPTVVTASISLPRNLALAEENSLNCDATRGTHLLCTQHVLYTQWFWCRTLCHIRCKEIAHDASTVLAPCATSGRSALKTRTRMYQLMDTEEQWWAMII